MKVIRLISVVLFAVVMESSFINIFVISNGFDFFIVKGGMTDISYGATNGSADRKAACSSVTLGLSASHQYRWRFGHCASQIIQMNYVKNNSRIVGIRDN